jgi:hypothetical protein
LNSRASHVRQVLNLSLEPLFQPSLHLFIVRFFLLLFFVLGGLNLGLRDCKACALQPKPHLQSLGVVTCLSVKCMIMQSIKMIVLPLQINTSLFFCLIVSNYLIIMVLASNLLYLPL